MIARQLFEMLNEFFFLFYFKLHLVAPSKSRRSIFKLYIYIVCYKVLITDQCNGKIITISPDQRQITLNHSHTQRQFS